MREFINMIYRQKEAKRMATVAILLAVLPVLVWGTMLVTRWLGRAAEPMVGLTFSPGSGTLPPDKSLGIVVEAGTEKISGAHVEFTFDTTRIQLAGEVQVTGVLTQVLMKTAVAEANATGRVKLALGLPLGQAGRGPSGNVELARVTFRTATASNTTTNVDFDGTKVEIVNDAATRLRVNPRGATLSSNTPTPSPTPAPLSAGGLTPTPSPTTAQLTFKIRLQGITTPANPQAVRLMFVNTDTDLPVSGYERVLITAEANGTYSGVAANVPAGTYNVFVKSPSHLQRRVATNLTLVEGQALIKNWTGAQQQLLVGDVNSTNTITIDDVATVLSKYTDLVVSVPPGTPEDVNADGRITVDDIALTLLNYANFTINGDQ